MKGTLYPRLAWQGITKNRKLYLPYLCTCVGMVMMCYILLSLASSPLIRALPGGNTMPAVLGLGSFTMAAFSAIFLFYTNSFLIRRRNREFGLYNILSMGKGDLARVLAWETLFTALVAIGIGMALGLTFSKLFELLLVNIVGGSVTTTFTVSLPSVCMTGLLFAGIFLLIFLRSLATLCTSSAASLLRSEAYGEKPPKANWLLGLAGFLLLGAAYYIAVSIQEPMTALVVFFIAVLMVIAATYLLFISGSVLLCRVLQKNKQYYYQKNHFVSVSSMAYRMKRNGAGLASVCILATMVLVMLSSTTCLYFGAEDALRTRYPYDFSFEVRVHEPSELSEENLGKLQSLLDDELAESGLTAQQRIATRTLWNEGFLSGDRLSFSGGQNLLDYESLVTLTLLPLEDYNAITGQSETLAPGEALLCAPRLRYDAPTLTLDDGTQYRIKDTVDALPGFGRDTANVIATMYLVVPDFEAVAEQSTWGILLWTCSFNTDGDDAQQTALCSALRQAPGDTHLDIAYESYSVEALAPNRGDFYGTYGSLFFLGIMLSLVFLAAAVLILYYKQISEGYEDQARFAIMQRVGMTKADIRRSINSQLLLVFFLPLLLAGLHLGFAFPFIHKLLILFNLNDLGLLIGTTALTFFVYAVFYAIVYRATSRSYYSIVAGAKEDAA